MGLTLVRISPMPQRCIACRSCHRWTVLVQILVLLGWSSLKFKSFQLDVEQGNWSFIRLRN